MRHRIGRPNPREICSHLSDWVLKQSEGLAAKFPRLRQIADVVVCWCTQLRRQALDAMLGDPPKLQSRVADVEAEASRVAIKSVKDKKRSKRAAAKLPDAAAENACKAQKSRRATKIQPASAPVSDTSHVRSGRKPKIHLPSTGDSISPASSAKTGSNGEGGVKAVEEHDVVAAEGRYVADAAASTDAVIAADLKAEPDTGPNFAYDNVAIAAMASAQSADSFEDAAEAQVDKAVTDAAIAAKPHEVNVVDWAASAARGQPAVLSKDFQVDRRLQSRAQDFREQTSLGASPIDPLVGTAGDATAGAGAPAGYNKDEVSAADLATGTEASTARSSESSPGGFDALELGELSLGSDARDKRLLWEVPPPVCCEPVVWLWLRRWAMRTWS